PLTPEQTHAYLLHIGIVDAGPPSLASLDRLLDAHLRRDAFENVDVMLDRPIELDAAKVFAKVVAGSRGGYSFELKSLFAARL
ncbi:arylamine N-acetyltransferase, partial [Pseudomonas aeruginosa]